MRDFVFNGKPVNSVKTAFNSAVRDLVSKVAVTPHTLRHTAAKWLMYVGVDKLEGAGYLGMSVEMIDRVHGPHHPKHLKTAALTIGYRPQKERW